MKAGLGLALSCLAAWFGAFSLWMFWPIVKDGEHRLVEPNTPLLYMEVSLAGIIFVLGVAGWVVLVVRGGKKGSDEKREVE